LLEPQIATVVPKTPNRPRTIDPESFCFSKCRSWVSLLEAQEIAGVLFNGRTLT
jgi:hypothetical protein